MVGSLFAAARSGSRRRAAWTLAAAFSVLGLWACRIGGSSSSPPLLDPVQRADGQRAGSGQSGNDSTTQVEAGSTSTTRSDAAAMETPARDSGASGAAGAASLSNPDSSVGGQPDAQASNPGEDAGDSCGQTIAVCDPIRKTGCAVELQLQCDVDLLAATPTGVCVFNAPSPDPNACLNIPPTESCPAGQTCVEGNCHAICLCDTECESGKCCNKPVGLGGLKVCAEC